VARAIEQGGLSVRRFESWQHLQRELAWRDARREARVKSARRRR
jgi:hypothetical protein